VKKVEPSSYSKGEKIKKDTEKTKCNSSLGIFNLTLYALLCSLHIKLNLLHSSVMKFVVVTTF
jgi:hypothetical protein